MHIVIILHFFSVSLSLSVYVDLKCVSTSSSTLTHSQTERCSTDYRRTPYKRSLYVCQTKNGWYQMIIVQCSYCSITASIKYIKDDYERAHICVSTRAHTRNLYSGAHFHSLRLCVSHNHTPEFECHNAAHLFNANTTTVYVLHCLIFGCHAWICAHFFPGCNFFFFAFIPYRPI